MEQKIRCVYRKKKCFHICNKTAIKNSFYCCHHIHSKKKHLCKIFFNVLEDRHEITLTDIYKIYVYIIENTRENDDIFINILFIDLLKMIPIDKLSSIYKDYINNYTITASKKRIPEIHSKIYLLNRHTHLFSNKCDTNRLIDFQNIIKYRLLCNANGDAANAANTAADYLNNDDVFSLQSINSIHPRKLFTIKDIKGVYAFDIVELEYFVRKCLKDNVEPYNPYTREAFGNKIIWRLNKQIQYNNIRKKSDDCRWTTDMNAYTDLSIEIERRGFYNNPEWFKKMSRRDFLKCIKLFRDFSSNVEESKRYFISIRDGEVSSALAASSVSSVSSALAASSASLAFTYDFCKESIRMFNECNDDLYILCCNFMKSLALCSNDFYNNIPEWLATYETTSYISNNLTSYISSLMNNNAVAANANANYNYEEYDYNNINNSIGDDLLNNRINNVLGSGDSGDIMPTSTTSTINPSNNFLLYYYVEYM